MTEIHGYSPAEVCQMFKIAKTTLFRWEQEYQINPKRKLSNDEREYSDENIKQIAWVQLGTLTTLFEKAAMAEDQERMRQILEEISRIKALYTAPLLGLTELGEYKTIPESVLRALLLKATVLDMSDPQYKAIIRLLYARLLVRPPIEKDAG